MLQHTVSFHHRPTIPTVFARAPVIHYIFTRIRYSQDGSRGFCQATQTTRLPILCAEQRGTVLIVVLSRPAECRSGITTDHSDPDWRLYLLLCIRAWLQLYLTYPIYSDVTQAFLAMAMRNGIVPTSHANEVMACFKQAGKHHERSEQPISTFIIDFSLAPVDPQNARICAIAETFEDMVIFDEFTTGDYVAQAEGGVTDGLDGK